MPPLFQLSVNAMLGSCSRPYNRNSFIKTSYVLPFQPLFAATRCFDFSRRPSAWGRRTVRDTSYQTFPEEISSEGGWSDYIIRYPEPEPPADIFIEIRNRHKRKKQCRKILSYLLVGTMGFVVGICVWYI